MTCVGKRACVCEKRSAYIYCKVLHRESNRCIAISFACAHDAIIANVYQFVERFRDQMEIFVIDHRETFEMRDTISRSMKRLQKSVILKMKSWRRDKGFILSTTNRTQSCIRRLERDLTRALERQVEFEQELKKTKMN
jgi:hypothetical protein